ncbi:MAG: DUF1592 domain-containing protein [Myxococcota bacterium]
MRIEIGWIGRGALACSLLGVACGDDAVAGTGDAGEDTDSAGDSTGAVEPGDSDGDAGLDETGEPPQTCEVDVGVTPLLRLTPQEFRNVVRDLVGVTVDVGALDPAEKVGPFDTNVSTPVSGAGVDQYRAIAEEVAWSVDLDAVAPCAAADAGCSEQFIEEFGRRAFRRPLTDDEIATYATLAATEATAADGMRLVVQAMLQSPQLLYRLEVDTPAGEASVVALSSFELATRLSFFLWDSAPDDTLLDAASDESLLEIDVLRGEAERMLDDARARTVVGDFHLQWLELDHPASVTKDPEYYPAWSESLQASMLTETRRFAESVVLFGDGRLSTLLTSPTSYLDDELFTHYGVDKPAGHTEGTPVELPPGERAGLLTQASFLSTHAHPNQSGPVQRGVVVRTNFLCQPPPPPPDDAMVIPPDPDPDATTREIFEQHVADPACAGCHVLFDGIGLGFEGYDGVGAFRTTQNGLPVDMSGELSAADVGGPFEGVVELADMLSESDMVRRCVASQWVRFALGRAESEADACGIAALQDEFTSSGGDVRALMLDIVTSETFRHRTGE